MKNESVSILVILIFIINIFFCLNMAQWSTFLNSVCWSHVYKITKPKMRGWI